jgi:hypothetical protein
MAQQRWRNDRGGASRRTAKLDDALARAAKHYSSLQAHLEQQHYGSYVMIDVETLEYVIAQTASKTHAKFMEKFGENGCGWCTRIGVSVFATA